MNEPLVFITGQLRSGTSLVASIMHRLGFPPVTLTAPPMAPKWLPEWEDYEGLKAVMQRVAWGHVPSKADRKSMGEWLIGYFARRLTVNETWRAQGFPIRGVCWKCPPAGFFWREIATAAVENGMLPLAFIVHRQPESVALSLAATHGLMGPDHLRAVTQTNRDLSRAVAEIPGHGCRFERLTSPDRTIAAAELSALGEYVGVTDPVELTDAASVIVQHESVV